MADSEELADLAAQLGVGARVRLLDQHPNVERLYPALDVFCLCSQAVEGFPNVVGEAMSCGVPCVVTRVGDAADVAGETGIAVPPRDVSELVAALNETIAKLDHEKVTMREACRARIEREFAIEKVIAEYERFYAERGR